MSLDLKRIRIVNGDIGISVPEGANVRACDLEFYNVRRAMEVRDKRALLTVEQLKQRLLDDPRLPPGTTWDELIEAFRQIGSVPPEQRSAQARATQLGGRLVQFGKWSLEIANHLVAIAEYCEKRGWL